MMRRRKHIALMSMLSLSLTAAATAAPASIGLATWNMAWLMDQATHERWRQACTKSGWQTTAEIQAQGLPYCDVHNGIDYRKKEHCAQSMGSASSQRPTQANSPDGKCRIGPDLADWSLYERKRQTLKETFEAMDRDGVTLIALQEVTNEDAVRPLLPQGWEVKTSAHLQGAPTIAQHVGLAWKTSHHQPSDFRALTELSAIGDRPLRPGLEFKFTWKDMHIQGMVVHLKAGCRSTMLNRASKSDQQADCTALAQQTAVVEKWIDERVNQAFVILGDFNRTLLDELKQYPQPDPQRFGATPVEHIQWMAPEWNDDHPTGSRITVMDHLRKPNDGSLIAGDYFCAQTKGIDHIILSASLAKSVQESGNTLVLHPVSYKFQGKRLPVDAKTVPPSDHCARFIRLR